MCYFRQVRNVYKKCGHGLTLPDEEVGQWRPFIMNHSGRFNWRPQIKCDLPNCKFSPAHPSSCRPPKCTESCWQYRQYPQQYSPHIDSACPTCSK
ncbi:hypothetical protein HYPSUDRAFT_245224 [Hypholoma sublateritium FD-334 SS-4]|uniref:Uncharacterized protein n=1 Tax=Hypholoma sublateritium (strain FD-334 SS-4) TaxID=945553 RepID=A0A0D2N0I1_HYPSF|nr:hypothetical protein HYPSUDRAFT_245224 [Hypholoma sublateritium FD-334 SS-4]